MLQDTLSMITAKPLLGWGYGGFEYSFAHFRLQAMPRREVLEVAGHPHNEILLWWVEGGLPALAGIVIVLIAGALLLKRAAAGSQAAGRCARRAISGAAANAGTHPAGIPFLSVCAALAGVSAAAGAAGRPNRRARPLPFAKALSLPVAMAAVGALVMAVFARQGRMALTQSERTMLATIDSIEQMPPPAARSTGSAKPSTSNLTRCWSITKRVMMPC